MPGTPNRAQQGLAAALSKLRGYHYPRQLITTGIFQTQTTWELTVQQIRLYKACGLRGEWCTGRKHQSSVHFHVHECHLDSTN